MLCEVCFLSYSSKQTKSRIILIAKTEFLNNSFLNANLREIAKKANVTTGALYNHFGNKEMLFEAIVGEFADELYEVFLDEHNRIPSRDVFTQVEQKDNMANGSFKILRFIYDNLDEAKLLFFHSNGTKYEYFIDKLIKIEEDSSIRALEMVNFDMNNVNKLFVHIMATSGVKNMIEVVRHDLEIDDALDYLGKIQLFYYAGVKEILGR